jgi:hypothetical protein
VQDWDRLVMIAVGVLVSIYTGYQGRSFWRRRQYLALAGIGVLILGAIAVPVVLALFTT